MIRGDRGQSTVEFALLLPLIALVLLCLVQGGLVLRDQLLVTAAAREGAREAAVTGDISKVERAAARSAGSLRIEVEAEWGRAPGDPVTVRVTGHPVAVPLVGRIVSGQTLIATATMRMESR